MGLLNPFSIRPSSFDVQHGARRYSAHTVNPIKLETGLRPNSVRIPSTLLLRIEAIGFPTFGTLNPKSSVGGGLRAQVCQVFGIYYRGRGKQNRPLGYVIVVPE